MKISQLNSSFDTSTSINVAEKLFQNSKGFAAMNRAKKINDS